MKQTHNTVGYNVHVNNVEINVNFGKKATEKIDDFYRRLRSQYINIVSFSSSLSFIIRANFLFYFQNDVTNQ